MEGMIGQHTRTACALEGEERFKDELIPVPHARCNGGFDHRVLAAHLIRTDRAIQLFFESDQNIETGHRGLDENKIRAAAYAHGVCLMTTITGAFAAVEGIRALRDKPVGVKPIQHYRGNVNLV